MAKIPKPGDLSSDEIEMLEFINSGNTNGLKQLLDSGSVRVDCLDKNGASPLMQAAFKGHTDTCRLLLQYGADVNINEHDHGYSALMFAALSGNGELCQLMLDYGAKPYRTNRINRTAAEMAGFVGQHECVSIINNYLCLEDIQRIIHPKGINTVERIPMKYSLVIHGLLKGSNVHPLKAVKFLQANVDLVDYKRQFLIILEEIFESQMKQKETNEVSALKIWMITFFLKEVLDFVEKNTGEDSRLTDLLNLYTKKLLLTDKDRDFCRNLETLVRQAIRSFPYHQSVLFQTLVKSVAQTEFGRQPTALNYANQAILGQRAISDTAFCAVCGEPFSKKRCSACKMVHYCSNECQKQHWFVHKRWCPSLAKQRFEPIQLDDNEQDESKREN